MEQCELVTGARRRTLFLLHNVTHDDAEWFKKELQGWWASAQDVGAIHCSPEARIEVHEIIDDRG